MAGVTDVADFVRAQKLAQQIKAAQIAQSIQRLRNQGQSSGPSGPVGNSGGGGGPVSTLSGLPQTPELAALIQSGMIREGMAPEQALAIMATSKLGTQVPIDIAALKAMIAGDYATSTQGVTGPATEWMQQLMGANAPKPGDPMYDQYMADPIFSEYAGGLQQMQETANTNQASDQAWFDKQQQAMTDYYNGLMASIGTTAPVGGSGGGGGGGGGRRGGGGGGGSGGGSVTEDNPYGFDKLSTIAKAVETLQDQAKSNFSENNPGFWQDTLEAMQTAAGMPVDEFGRTLSAEDQATIMDHINNMMNLDPEGGPEGVLQSATENLLDLQGQDLAEQEKLLGNEAWTGKQPGRLQEMANRYLTNTGMVLGDNPETNPIEWRYEDPALDDAAREALPVDPTTMEQNAIDMGMLQSIYDPNTVSDRIDPITGNAITAAGMPNAARILNSIYSTVTNPDLRGQVGAGDGGGDGQTAGGPVNEDTTTPAPTNPIDELIRQAQIAQADDNNPDVMTTEEYNAAMGYPSGSNAASDNPAPVIPQPKSWWQTALGSAVGQPQDKPDLTSILNTIASQFPPPTGPLVGSVPGSPQNPPVDVGGNVSNPPTMTPTGIPLGTQTTGQQSFEEPDKAANQEWLAALGQQPFEEPDLAANREWLGQRTPQGAITTPPSNAGYGRNGTPPTSFGNRPWDPSMLAGNWRNLPQPAPPEVPMEQQMQEGFGNESPYPPGEQWREQLWQGNLGYNGQTDLSNLMGPLYEQIRSQQQGQYGLPGEGDSAKEQIFSKPSVTLPPLGRQDLANVFGTADPYVMPGMTPTGSNPPIDGSVDWANNTPTTTIPGQSPLGFKAGLTGGGPGSSRRLFSDQNYLGALPGQAQMGNKVFPASGGDLPVPVVPDPSGDDSSPVASLPPELQAAALRLLSQARGGATSAIGGATSGNANSNAIQAAFAQAFQDEDTPQPVSVPHMVDWWQTGQFNRNNSPKLGYDPGRIGESVMNMLQNRSYGDYVAELRANPQPEGAILPTTKGEYWQEPDDPQNLRDRQLQEQADLFAQQLARARSTYFAMNPFRNTSVTTATNTDSLTSSARSREPAAAALTTLDLPDPDILEDPDTLMPEDMMQGFMRPGSALQAPTQSEMDRINNFNPRSTKTSARYVKPANPNLGIQRAAANKLAARQQVGNAANSIATLMGRRGNGKKVLGGKF